MEFVRLTPDNIGLGNCCPGGLEVRDKKFIADLQKVLDWRRRQVELGLTGFLVHDGDVVRGFIEYMPEHTAPVPVIAPGAAVLICYHWEPPTGDPHGPEHLKGERKLLQKALDDAREAGYGGMVTLAWDIPIHYPASEFEELGFRRITTKGQLALMWYPFVDGVAQPRMAERRLEPASLSGEGRIAIEIGYSSRCPYSLESLARLERTISELPERDLVVIRKHLIDTREQALATLTDCWNWEWSFVNGKETFLFGQKADEVRRLIRDELTQ